jgi:hypothetical protein
MKRNYNVSTLQFTWRQEKNKLDFDNELAEYLNIESESGRELFRIDYVVDPGDPGYVADIKAVVITKAKEE